MDVFAGPAKVTMSWLTFVLKPEPVIVIVSAGSTINGLMLETGSSLPVDAEATN